MTFYSVETVREKQFGTAGKDSLKDAPSQTAIPQRLFDLGAQVLNVSYCLYNVFIPLPPANKLIICKFAASL